jgi:hypothetical protein
MKYRGSALRTELTKINLPASHSKRLSYILQGAFAVISCKNESLAGLFFVQEGEVRLLGASKVCTGAF